MTTKHYRVPPKLVGYYLKKNGQPKTIREIGSLCGDVERRLLKKRRSRQKLFRMHIGNPSVDTPRPLINYQCMAINSPGITNSYAPCDGDPTLKKEASNFLSKFCDVYIPPKYCISSAGGAHGLYLVMKAWHDVLQVNNDTRDTMLLFAPYFPVHKMQADDVNFKTESIEFYDYRGEEKLRDELERLLSKGNIHSILYSNPNNPAWLSLTKEELAVIGELADKYNVLVIEDLAYFGMDFRYDYSRPGEAPYQPTVAKHCKNYAIVLSSSKFISYPGERCGIVAISPSIGIDSNAELSPAIYDHIAFKGMALTISSVPHSSQVGMAMFLRDLNNGKINFREALMEYRDKAKKIKNLFIEKGFYLTYADDCGEPIADGFYFTISRIGFSSEQLFLELTYYGIFVVPLNLCGSKRDGVRICISFVNPDDIPELENSLKLFDLDHTNE